MDTQDGRWVDDPPLPPLAKPPDRLIETSGARLIRVYNVNSPDPRRRDGYTEAVVLARAPIPGGGWAVLAAWLGGWQEGGRTSGRARFGWCRWLTDRCKIVTPHVVGGAEWHGWPAESEFAQAVRLAAACLPEHLRAAALTPAANSPAGSGDLPS